MQTLVTAASGNLGRTLVRVLSEDHQIVAGSRQPSDTIEFANVEGKRLDYDDPGSFDGALKGVQSVVLQAPPLDSNADMRLFPFIDAMKAHGIGRVVFISAFGVQHNENAPLRKIEQRLMADNFDTTILRPTFFMENFTTGFAAPAIEHDGIIVASAGDAKLAFVSIEDIAAVAARVLIETDHNGQAYNLAGPEALSHHDVAVTISNIRAHKTKYIALTPDEMKAGAMEHGVPESEADYLVKLYDLAAKGAFSQATGDIEAVTGKTPRSLADVLTS